MFEEEENPFAPCDGEVVFLREVGGENCDGAAPEINHGSSQSVGILRAVCDSGSHDRSAGGDAQQSPIDLVEEVRRALARGGAPLGDAELDRRVRL